jgi:hypothetical protein
LGILHANRCGKQPLKTPEFRRFGGASQEELAERDNSSANEPKKVPINFFLIDGLDVFFILLQVMVF